MPQQAPPVDRNEATPAAALADNPAVQASGKWGVVQQPFIPWHLDDLSAF
jgi:hypothetical protein